MNLERIKQVLKKVNALIENLDDQGQTSAIERDLLLRYLRDLYEDVSNPKAISDVMSIEENIAPSPVVEQKQPTTPVESAAIIKDQERVVAPAAPVTEQNTPTGSVVPESVSEVQNQTTFYDASTSLEPKVVPASEEVPTVTQPAAAVINKFENPVQYFPPTEEATQETVQAQASAVAESIKTPVTQADETTPVAPQVEQTKSMSSNSEIVSDRFDSVFVEKSAADIADKYQLQRVVTIEGAMGINERMQTTNELFGGEHNVFMETVTHINSLTDFETARQYLIKGAATRFNWDADERMGMAAEFVQLVRRKFS